MYALNRGSKNPMLRVILYVVATCLLVAAAYGNRTAWPAWTGWAGLAVAVFTFGVLDSLD